MTDTTDTHLLALQAELEENEQALTDWDSKSDPRPKAEIIANIDQLQASIVNVQG